MEGIRLYLSCRFSRQYGMKKRKMGNKSCIKNIGVMYTGVCIWCVNEF